MTWRYIGPTLVGNELPQTSNISIFTSVDAESNTANNDLETPVVIQYGAISDLEISSL